MSKLEKLMIQGIRSFSPQDKNVIEFQSPLTIIVGANGTGKTTIIECLKFATTGDMPPNSRGGAFVYDPKLAREIDVKAEVKLRFSSVKDEVMTCSRVMQSSIKKSKGEQKTLECSLSKEFNGKNLLITSKIADIDRQVPDFLGISHSILDNVIFCHQDESVWPIGDPTVMKKKLDDIFSSTKYNKALLGLKASKKEINTDLKLKSQQLTFFLKEKLKKDDILKNIKFYTEEIEKKNSKIRLFSDEIEKIDLKIQTMRLDLKLYEKLENNYKMLKSESENCLNFIKNFPYPIIKGLERDSIVSNIVTLEKELSDLNSSKIEEEFTNFEFTRQKILDQNLKNEKYLKSIEDSQIKIEKLAEERFKLISELTSELKCKENEIPVKIQESFTKLEQEIKQRTALLNTEREALMFHRSEQKNYEKFQKESLAFIAEHKDLKVINECDLVEIPADYGLQVELEADLDDLLEDLNSKQQELNEAYRNSNGHFKRAHLLESIEKLKKELPITPEEYKRKLNIEISKRDRINNELKNILQSHQRNLILNEQRASSNSKLINEINSAIKKIESNEISLNALNLINSKQPNFTSEEILKIKNEFPVLSIQSPIDISSFEIDLETTKNIILTSNSALKVYENFVKIADQKKQCPLCIRPFEGRIKDEFDLKLDKAIKKIPCKVEDLKNRQNDLETHIERMKNEQKSILECNSIKHKLQEQIKELETYEPVFDAEIKKLEIEKSENANIVEKLTEKLQDCKSKSINLKILMNDLEKIPQPLDTAPLEKRIKEVKNHVDLKRRELSEYSKRIKESEARKKLIDQKDEIKKIIEKRNFLINELEKVPKFDISSLEEKVATLEKKQEGFNQKLIKAKMIIEMKTKRIEEIDTQVAYCNTEIQMSRTNISDLYKHTTVNFKNEVLNFEDLKNPKRYEAARQAVISYKNQIIKTSKDIEKGKYDLKIIDENFKLKKCKERALSIDEELGKFDAVAFKKLRTSLDSNEEKKIKLTALESTIKGELKQIAHSIKTLNSELEQYKESNRSFLVCSIEIKALEFSLEDLDKCINGLDKSIVDFHSSKIEDVNRTLKDLWMTTYKGNDIDYIELKAESSDTRAYNYRLVMVKNGTELDMRGRSSAGQKMVASILFRIALADSFSQGCNIFALDEPTTNLDRENIESLATTLASIIKNRASAQFIVITHDEEFVQLLNREGTEYFYRLQRDSKGSGHIQRHSIYRH